MCVNSSLSLCISSVTDWQSAQGVPCLSPCDVWDRFQPFHCPGIRMDGWMTNKVVKVYGIKHCFKCTVVHLP